MSNSQAYFTDTASDLSAQALTTLNFRNQYDSSKPVHKYIRTPTPTLSAQW